MKKIQEKKVKEVKKINKVKLSATEILKKNPLELSSDNLYFDAIPVNLKKLFPNQDYTRNGTKKIFLVYNHLNGKLNGINLNKLGFTFKRGGSTNNFIKKLGYTIEKIKLNESNTRIIDGVFKKVKS